MNTKDSTSEARRRGAPKGNRNAWKHGGRSATAKAARDVDRARIVDRLPDASLFTGIARHSEAELRRLLADLLAAGSELGEQGDCIARRKEGEGDPPSIFSENKTNDSVAQEPVWKRGAPKGNRNALKHGYNSGKQREFDSSLRDCLRRLNATCTLADAIARAGRVP